MNNDVKNLLQKKSVLLFYKEYEADKFIKYDRYLKRILRPLYHKLHHRQKKSGFAVSFELMRKALENTGHKVHVNDYRTARKNPAYPVGLVGFPVLLENWNLPNPALLGPSLYDHPMLAPNLFDNPHYRKYVALAPWTKDMYAPVYGDRCFCWFAGIDLKQWPDLSNNPKKYDFLVYDKIRWDHDQFQTSLIDPILKELTAKSLSYRLLRYKMHDHETFHSMLGEARGFLFLCEHETQGLAYQEAMASNVPVLAWDRGFWADPLGRKYTETPPPASSVPFFSSECGEKFKSPEDFKDALKKFIPKRTTYKPRDYVTRELNPTVSAQIYSKNYFNIMDKQS
jgi:glycosyltransferase involved in cell wall biosynthesis